MSDSLINKKEEIEVEVAQGEESSPKSTIYSCRHCSHVLFNELVINPHLNKKSNKTCMSEILHIHSPFDEEILGNNYNSEWLQSQMNNPEIISGRIHCPTPQCGVRLGSFNWTGGCCDQCKQWIVPLIQITKSKIDKKRKSGYQEFTDLC